MSILALAIHRAHVDDAFQTEHSGDGGGGDAVLARASLGNNARFAHALRQKNLAHCIVDLVRAGVVEVFTLEINFRAAEFARQAFGKVERRGTADKFLEVIGKLALEFRVMLRAEIFGLKLLQWMHQRLGHVTSAVRAKMAGGIG